MRAADDVSSDEAPEKAPRMTTNKKKASNFFTTANVKNKCVASPSFRSCEHVADRFIYD